MATKRPSFLKRQKELLRTARALEKRAARRERKEARAAARDTSTSADRLVEGSEKNRDNEP